MAFSSPAVRPNAPAYLPGLPHLSADFCATFTSVFVQTPHLRLHVVVGGQGPVLLLLGGWPQTWYAWRLIMPALARQYTVVAVDPRGVGLSDKPVTGYDSATLATDMVELMQALGYARFAMVGHDIGMWTGYALAVDHPNCLVRLAVAEAIIPGVSPSVPLFSNGAVNAFLWHFAFNWADDINERMVRGREEIYFGHQFASKAATPEALPAYAVAEYVAALKASPQALTASFEYYRAIDTIMAQNAVRRTTRLTLPVLAIAGREACDESVAQEMRLVATDVTSLIISACGHFVPEEAPEALVAALQAFLEPYRTAEI